MIETEIDESNGVAVLKPHGPLSVDDFKTVSKVVDAYIDRHHGKLNGLIIYAASFPGWVSFAALLEHLQFVKDHRKQIQKVAMVTDSRLLTILPSIADHFVNAEIKHFPFDDFDEAKEWIRSASK